MKAKILLIIPTLLLSYISIAQSDYVEETKFRSRLSVGFNAGYQQMQMEELNEYFDEYENVGNNATAFSDINGGVIYSLSLNYHFFKSKRLIVSVLGEYTKANSTATFDQGGGTGSETWEIEYRPMSFIATAAASYKLLKTDRFNLQVGGGLSYHIAFLVDKSITEGEETEFTGPMGLGLGALMDGKIEFYLLHRLSVVAGAAYRYIVIKELSYVDGGIKSENPFKTEGQLELDFSGINLTGGVRFYIF